MIRRFWIASMLVFLFPFLGLSQSKILEAANDAFTYGEELKYKVKYNLYFNINVGIVNFKIANEPKNKLSAECYNIVSKGRTMNFYDNFFKVRDHYETYMAEQSLLPKLFIRRINEGGYTKTNNVKFYHDVKSAMNEDNEVIEIEPNTQDVVSALYYARTFDFENASVGDSLKFPLFIDNEVYEVGLKYMGKEVISTNFGEYKCLKIKPILIVGRVFDSEESMTLWVTDDANKIPLRIESGISVGAIRADLVDYENIRSDFMKKEH